MDAGHGSGGGRLAGSGGRALVGAQLRRVLVVGIVVPLAVGAVIALVGACWAYAAGAEPATMAMIAFTQAYPLTVGVCAVAGWASCTATSDGRGLSRPLAARPSWCWRRTLP